MSNIYEIDHLKLLSKETMIRSDLTIKFVGTDETLDVHKYILAMVSTVYELQLYGEMSEHARAEEAFSGSVEIIEENDFPYKTYYMFIRHIYGDKEIIKNCCSYESLFQLLQMAKLYLIEKLSKLIELRITGLPITMDLLIPSLKTVLVYQKLEGFREICENVNRNIVDTFSALPLRDQYKFYKLQRQGSSEVVAALIALMAENVQSTPAETKHALCTVDMSKFYKFYEDHKEEQPEYVKALFDVMSDFVLEDLLEVVDCTNCLMPAGKCKNGKLFNAHPLPHQGMLYKTSEGAVFHVESVSITDIVVRQVDKPRNVRVKSIADLNLGGRTYLCQL